MGAGLGQRGISGNRAGIGRSVGEALHDLFGGPTGREVLGAISAGFGNTSDMVGAMGSTQAPIAERRRVAEPGGGSYGGAPGNGFGHGSSGTMGSGSQNPGADYHHPVSSFADRMKSLPEVN